MTSCDRFGSEVGAYLDRELPGALRLEFEAHLSGCAACREALAAQRQLGASLQALAPIEPSPQFEARFWARIAREEHTPGPLRAWLERWRLGARLEWALAATALAAVVLWFAWSPSGVLIPDEEWEIFADAEQFELLQLGDLELLGTLDVLETWDGSEEI